MTPEQSADRYHEALARLAAYRRDLGAAIEELAHCDDFTPERIARVERMADDLRDIADDAETLGGEVAE